MALATRTDVESVIEILQAANPSWRPRASTLDVWCGMLNDLEAETLLRAARRCGQEHKGVPGVPTLREYVRREEEELQRRKAAKLAGYLTVLDALPSYVEGGGELEVGTNPHQLLQWASALRDELARVKPGEAYQVSEADAAALESWWRFFYEREAARKRERGPRAIDAARPEPVAPAAKSSQAGFFEDPPARRRRVGGEH